MPGIFDGHEGHVSGHISLVVIICPNQLLSLIILFINAKFLMKRGRYMIRIAIVVAIAASASACQSNVPYDTSKQTCGMHEFRGFQRKVYIPDTPNKVCNVWYNPITRDERIWCQPLTRKATDPKARARQLAGSKYP